MKRISGGAALLLATISILSAYGSAKPAGAQNNSRDMMMLLKSTLKYRGYKTFSETVIGKITERIRDDSGGVVVRGNFTRKVVMEQPNRFRIETELTFLGKRETRIIVSDGMTIWDWDKTDGVYSERPFESVFQPKDFDLTGDWLHSHFGHDETLGMFIRDSMKDELGGIPGAEKSIEIANYPSRIIDGNAMYVIPMTYVERDKSKHTGALYIGKSDLFVHRARWEKRDANSKNVVVEFILFYRDIAPNAPLSADLFAFKPPGDAQKVDRVKPLFSSLN